MRILAAPKLKADIISSGYMTVNIIIGTDVSNKYAGMREQRLYRIAMHMRCEDLFFSAAVTPTIMLAPIITNNKITCIST